MVDGVHCELVHSSSGRARFRVPMLAHPGAPLAQFNAWLKSLSGVDDARVNSACAAVVVTFDPEGKVDAAAIQASIEGVDLERFRSAPLGGPENSGNQPSWFSFILSSTGQSPPLAIATAGCSSAFCPGRCLPAAPSLS